MGSGGIVGCSPRTAALAAATARIGDALESASPLGERASMGGVEGGA